VRPHERHPADVLRLVLGTAVFAAGVATARMRGLSAFEVDLFHVVNDLPDAFRIPSEIVMGLGTPAAVAVVTALALAARRWWMALAVALAGTLGDLTSHLIRELVQRDRPLDLLTHVMVRGPRITGFGYPSGHATIAAALAAAAGIAESRTTDVTVRALQEYHRDGQMRLGV
jgi:membrane-associated phospholipid phosphatase